MTSLEHRSLQSCKAPLAWACSAEDSGQCMVNVWGLRALKMLHISAPAVIPVTAGYWEGYHICTLNNFLHGCCFGDPPLKT